MHVLRFWDHSVVVEAFPAQFGMPNFLTDATTSLDAEREHDIGTTDISSLFKLLWVIIVVVASALSTLMQP